jgi:hypothetical protein
MNGTEKPRSDMTTEKPSIESLTAIVHGAASGGHLHPDDEATLITAIIELQSLRAENEALKTGKANAEAEAKHWFDQFTALRAERDALAAKVREPLEKRIAELEADRTLESLRDMLKAALLESKEHDERVRRGALEGALQTLLGAAPVELLPSRLRQTLGLGPVKGGSDGAANHF